MNPWNVQIRYAYSQILRNKPYPFQLRHCNKQQWIEKVSSWMKTGGHKSVYLTFRGINSISLVHIPQIKQSFIKISTSRQSTGPSEVMRLQYEIYWQTHLRIAPFKIRVHCVSCPIVADFVDVRPARTFLRVAVVSEKGSEDSSRVIESDSNCVLWYPILIRIYKFTETLILNVHKNCVSIFR